MTPITLDRWHQAQQAERKLHKMGFNEGIGHYYWSYRNYFKYLDILPDQQGKMIIEIGPADFPAFMFCYNINGIIIEPMQSDYLAEIAKRIDIDVCTTPVEHANKLPKCDEIWLLNVMQHVIDPEVFVSKCKDAADVIRFFEPINQPTCEHHPHTFSDIDYINWYGIDVVKYYTDKLPGFFDDVCVYGVWAKNDV